MHGAAIQPVILCGGSGSRLWPLSRTAMPKPFIPLNTASAGAGGGSHTLFQQTALRVTGDNFLPPVVICATAHRFYVISQLAELGITPAAIILEPTPRNTAAAIALAAEWATGTTAPLALLAADHLMGSPQEFQAALQTAATLASENIVLFGITPTFANTEYGYIRMGETLANAGAHRVEAFLEKPNRAKAEELLATGNHVWNSGIFTAAPALLATEINTHAPQIATLTNIAWEGRTAETVMGIQLITPAATFAEVPSAQFDTAVLEKTTHAAVLPYTGRWSDIGGFAALAAAMPQDDAGNSHSSPESSQTMAPDTTGSLIHTSVAGKVVAVHGMSDVVVVDTPDALLVTTKSRAAGVKAIFETLTKSNQQQAHLHQRVHRPWGWYETIVSGQGYLVKRIGVVPQGRLSLQYHHHRAEHWTVVTGTATVTLGTISHPRIGGAQLQPFTTYETLTLQPDQSTYIPLGAHHRLENLTDTLVEIIEVQTGEILEESDIIRLDDIYNRI